MVVSTAPPSSTGPTLRANTSTKALRDRIEKQELAIKRLQANRNPQSFLVHQLTNAQPMSQVADQQFMMYDQASGQYVPSFVSEIRNPYGNSFVEIFGTVITIQAGGCGPIIINGPGVQINTALVVEFTTTLNENLTVNADALFAGGLTTFDTNILAQGTVKLTGIPITNPGLPHGQVWQNGNVLNIT
jgi:hypothetical protein